MQVSRYYIVLFLCWMIEERSLYGIDQSQQDHFMQVSDQVSKKVQSLLSGSCDQGKLEGFLSIVRTIVWCGYKLFVKDKPVYDQQKDVLDHPYKKMLYGATQSLEQLFIAANNQDNFADQVQARILLSRALVPEWYIKSFNKGIERLCNTCFDEQGNFKELDDYGDMRIMFKEYCRKAPHSWQEIARIADWWCKNKKISLVRHARDGYTDTEFNNFLLKLASINCWWDIGLLKKLSQECTSPLVEKIYQALVAEFLRNNVNEFGMWKGADQDPWWQNMPWYQKERLSRDLACNEILIMRDMRVQEFLAWMSIAQGEIFVAQDHLDIIDRLYATLPTNQLIFDDEYHQHLFANFFQSK